jgi:amino acid adenylation domain-containing protein
VLVHELLVRAAAARDDHPAVIDSTATWSYAELSAATRRSANWLRAKGVGAGDRVLYSGASDRRFLAFCYAAASIGAIFVPVHPDLTAAQLGFITGDSGARVALAGAVVPEAGPETCVVAVDDAWAEVERTTEAPVAPPVARPEDPALLIYTSGTTGNPKGVVCPHATVLAAVRSINTCLGYTPDDVVLCRLPLSFDYGLYQALLCALTGATLLLADRAADRTLVKLLHRHRVSVVPLVPSLAQMLTVLQRHDPRPTAVRLFTNTGARLGREIAAELLRTFPGARYASMYGMTECKRISILDVDEYARHPDSVGRPIPGDHIRIDGPDGTTLPPREVGEIVVWGATVMAGYWRVPLESQQRYVRRTDGSLELHTGDQGYLDEDGRLYFVGRDDDMIKRRGIRVGLTEIENAAELVPGVEAAVALRPAREDAPLHLAVVARVPAEEVRRGLAARLDRARMPDQVTLIDAVPLTPNGKPDRAAVAGRLQAGPRVPTPANPVTPTPTTRESHDPARVR